MTTAFRVTRRVEFHETDMAGIVHFSNFFRYMEFAEVEFLRAKGLSVAWREAHGERIGFPRVSAACDYRRPVRFDDVMEIAVKVARIGDKSVTYEFDFTCRGEEIAHGKVTAAYCVKHPDGTLEAIEIPAELRTKLES
ncbi:MAG TPA: thioesterase family protein [Gemmataceae bacterium]|jgi:YbgC/YbaW family acyl-CoA thioester hydrolase|nr:thioesterase family protein [Gemmataceae bacterium]